MSGIAGVLLYTISLQRRIQAQYKAAAWVDLMYWLSDLESPLQQDWSELLFHCQFCAKSYGKGGGGLGKAARSHAWGEQLFRRKSPGQGLWPFKSVR